MVGNGDRGAAGLVTARRNAGGRSSTLGVFAEDDWNLGNLVLTGGARVDRWTITGGFSTERDPAGAIATTNDFADRDGWRATGRAGALLNISEPLSLRAAAYTGFRLPTLNELYRPFTVFRSEEHTSELQSLMRISYAVFCLKKKK